MSRIGKKPIEIPQGVTVEMNANKITVSGSKGKMELVITHDVKVEIKDNLVTVDRANSSKKASAMWGTTNRLIGNMITGVSEGFSKVLELNGVGFRMEVNGKKLKMALGFSHPVEVEVPQNLEAKVENNTLAISGIDKQAVGQFAAEIRSLKPVEPYKGKGFRYSGEIVRRKEGKKASA
ncbi:MAG: 50S ribosomal protein L6 [Candidatus Moranbacteria bacterium GW2011_GWF2_34_56]|nr:MAG: 50S ribosomal protein L6 [Candidatus Moranbacteria bacterium GW2011_GWF1_34_10]KKP65252.1 MAG: 50S ribosomal protein L6 [Candidatus Moranbacteria bacterium GW2011_GWF2_34_56]HBI17493.1 50S ribosomal protein L6 [Candidatus Moranbacteria bacterium]